MFKGGFLLIAWYIRNAHFWILHTEKLRGEAIEKLKSVLLCKELWGCAWNWRHELGSGRSGICSWHLLTLALWPWRPLDISISICKVELTWPTKTLLSQTPVSPFFCLVLDLGPCPVFGLPSPVSARILLSQFRGNSPLLIAHQTLACLQHCNSVSRFSNNPPSLRSLLSDFPSTYPYLELSAVSLP